MGLGGSGGVRHVALSSLHILLVSGYYTKIGVVTPLMEEKCGLLHNIFDFKALAEGFAANAPG
jgi:hypothetical protein